VIGVWSTTDRRSTNGTWVQVSRLGNPLVNEAVVPLKYKDAFNGLEPYQDHTVTPVVNKVYDPILPKLIQKVYGIQAPATPRNDIAEIFLTGICKACGPIQADLNSQLLNKGVAASKFVPAEELRLNMSIPPTASPNRLGVIGGDLQGFPNGRRLGDDVIDIAVQALEGAAQSGQIVAPLAAGDGVDANDVPFGTTFPYIALPHAGSVNQAGSASNAVIGGARSGHDDGSGLGSFDPATTGLMSAIGAALLLAGVLGIRRRRAALA